MLMHEKTCIIPSRCHQTVGDYDMNFSKTCMKLINLLFLFVFARNACFNKLIYTYLNQKNLVHIP